MINLFFGGGYFYGTRFRWAGCLLAKNEEGKKGSVAVESDSEDACSCLYFFSHPTDWDRLAHSVQVSDRAVPKSLDFPETR